jgi:hypothetical protein
MHLAFPAHACRQVHHLALGIPGIHHFVYGILGILGIHHLTFGI